MKPHRKTLLLFLLVAVALLAAGCSTGMPAVTPEPQATPEPVAKAPTPSINELPLTDKMSLYADDDPTKLAYFYVTVRKGNAADGTDHTFAEVNSYRNLQGMTNVQQILAEALVQEGDENGPQPGMLGYGQTASNATINVRGRTSTYYPQKSYRLDLLPNAGLWRDQRAIALNKHPSDVTRLRNMLFFTLIQQVPDLTSLRTQYVQLFVKDETAEPAQTEFHDFGLFTQVELPNGRYLRNHDLSRNGNLYKANLFEMFRHEDVIKPANDPTFDQVAFNALLEPKTSADHTKLMEMLDAVNNYTIPIEEVIEKHFDLGNLTSYLAFNMLMANPDSNAQNYLLYSPVNSDKWYYINWDGDGALAYYEDEASNNLFVESPWTRGVSDYWGVILFQRMLKVPEYRRLLNERMEYLHQNVVNKDSVNALIERIRPLPDAFAARMPDSINLRMTLEQRNDVLANMAGDVELGYQNYLASLKKPMPFYMGTPESDGTTLTLSWDPSYDFGDGLLHYDVQVATDWTFNPDTIIFENRDQLHLSATLPLPKAGTYFWRVTVRNDQGETQVAFDQVVTATRANHGMLTFTITPEGQVTI